MGDSMMRWSLQETISRHGCPMRAIEVGVMDGVNAYAMLSESTIRFLVLVDPYRPYGEIPDQAKQDENKFAMLDKLKAFSDRMIFMPTFSQVAAGFYPDGFFDYVYIDATHSYESVKQDVNIWYPKVRVGGILAGHDYGGGHLGVNQAVDEFANQNHLVLSAQDNDWLIEK